MIRMSSFEIGMGDCLKAGMIRMKKTGAENLMVDEVFWRFWCQSLNCE
jgi:hypothetical protein